MKKILLFLTLALLTINSFGAIPFKPQTDEMILGKGANTLDKFLTFDVGDGAGNPQILIDDINKIFEFNKNISTTGNVNAVDANFSGVLDVNGNDSTFADGTNTDKKLILDVGSGASNPYFGWNATSNALVFNNGLSEKKIGSGSGGGAGGINFLVNSSFEDAGTPILNWNTSGGTLTQETHTNGREANEKFARFVATTVGQFLESDTVIISDDMGPGCMADMKYMQGDGAFEYKVLKSPFSDPTDVISEGTVGDLLEFEKAPTIVFPCQGGDQLKIRFTSTGAGTIDLDEAYLGSNKGFVDGQSIQKSIAYTPVFDEFGTVSEVDFTYMHIGDKLHIQGRFRAGTLASSTEAKVYLPPGFTTKFSDSFGKPVGVYFRHVSNASNGGSVIAVDGRTYLAFSASGVFNNSSVDPSNTSSSGGMMNNGEAMTLNVVVPVGTTPKGAQEAFLPEQSEFEAIAVLDSPNFFIGTTFAEQTISNGSMTLNNIKGSCQIACAGTEESSGTTCSAGNESLGISCNLPNAGRYEVCADMNMSVSSGSGAGGGSMNLTARVVETENASQTFIQSYDEFTSWGFSNTSVAGTHASENKQKFCQVFDVNSTGKRTFRVTMNGVSSGAANGATYIGTSSGKNTGLKFTVKQVAHEVSRPIINNMVDTSVKAGIRTESCRVLYSGTPTIDPASGLCGFIDNIAVISTGRYTVNFVSGTFSGPVVCTGSPGAGGSKIASFNNATANSVEVLNYSDAGSLEAGPVNFSCKGLR